MSKDSLLDPPNEGARAGQADYPRRRGISKYSGPGRAVDLSEPYAELPPRKKGSSGWVRSTKGAARIPVQGLKATREALAAAQSALVMVAQRGVAVDMLEPRLARLQALIDQIDEHRPLGPDGKHGERHTSTCGCE